MGKFVVKLSDGREVTVKKPGVALQDEYLEKFADIQKAKPEEGFEAWKAFREYRVGLLSKICVNVEPKLMEEIKDDLDEMELILGPWEDKVRSFMGTDFIRASAKQVQPEESTSSSASKKESSVTQK